MGIVSRVSTIPAHYPPPFSAEDYVKKPDGPADLRIDCGVAIVGGGPAGMACAVRLGQLLGEDPATLEKLGEVPLMELEKGRTPGAHELSGDDRQPQRPEVSCGPTRRSRQNDLRYGAGPPARASTS